METNKRLIAILIALAVAFCIGATAFAYASENGGEAAETDSSIVSGSDTYSDDTAVPIEESTITPTKGAASNATFFAGAVLAVLAFAGVAVFCKVKGNK